VIIKAVIGLGFGDEGKGMFTDYLCSHTANPLVIRFNGGHQAGHTVVPDTYSPAHVFSNFGSGTLRDVPTYWSKFCTIYPVGILNELKVLKADGYKPVLYIDERCPITTPYEIIQNKLDDSSNQHGSVGVGFGRTIEREEKFYHLNFIDLFYPQVFNAKMNLLAKYYGFGYDDGFIDACQELISTSKINRCYDIPRDSNYDLIFEGAQGLMLDQHYGFFPHVTRSNTGSKNVLEIINENYQNERINYMYLVTRAYQTRHGNGPMTNPRRSHNIDINPNETNKTNFQGEFRRTLLDVSLLEYAIKKDDHIRNRNNILVVTCLDHIENDYRFTYNDRISSFSNEDDFVREIAFKLKIKHVLRSRTPYPNIEERVY